MPLTGAQISQVLEQQWQPRARPTRPFLKLGVSEGFEYAYTTDRALDNPRRRAMSLAPYQPAGS